MDQRLGVVHEAVPQGGDFPMEGLVLIETRPHEILVAGGDDILVPGVHGLGQIRLREHQILRDVAQLGLVKNLTCFFFSCRSITRSVVGSKDWARKSERFSLRWS